MISQLDPFPARSAPNPAIGFTAILNGSPAALKKSQQTINQALAYFEDINQKSLNFGETSLTIWGRGKIENCYHALPDGSVLILIGSPVGNFSWQDIEEMVLHVSTAGKFTLPWEGRVILLKIEPKSNTWTLWNDWVGSIPVFHTETNSIRIASTLEPVVVNTIGYTPNDISLPSLMALLIWGHYFSDWSLFRDMKALLPDGEATWDQTGFRFTRYLSVKPTHDRWESGWDDLIDEMHALSKKAITSSLIQNPQWILPLSSGLDSRLIAAVAAEQNMNIYAYTWGSPKSSDVIFAKKIAHAMSIPWKSVDIGNTYLTSYINLWIDLLGSAMHFHGMYQMPFLDTLKHGPAGPIASGFLGDCLAGYATKFLCEVHSNSTPFQIAPDGYLHWKVNELPQLMKIPIQDALEELTAEVEKMLASIPGALYQQLGYIILWGRQRHFTCFQSILSDYWRGVTTPFLDREYARFSFSLSRAVLDNRILQQAMLSRYYTKLAAIPGTYASEPALLTGSYIMKKRIARPIPPKVSRILFPEFNRNRSKTDIDCVKHDSREAFKPLFERLDVIKEWMNIDIIEKNYQRIVAENDLQAVRKLQSIQTLAYRLSTDQGT